MAFYILFGIFQVVAFFGLVVVTSSSGILPLIAVLLFWIGGTLVLGFLSLIWVVRDLRDSNHRDAEAIKKASETSNR